MTQPAIRVEKLGKQYQLGLREAGYRTLRESIVQLAKAPLRRFRHLSGSSAEAERIWALRDVSFEVQSGEVVGIIGRNGAGKSTLLKILTRITEPTTGRAEVRGQVGSLLEVGTGFHPELTGRENVFLNGAILGMSRAKIKQKFDEIVDFSGVEQFLDTPVKRYSSGMNVRLAFAVAAHLDPEILLIDEVLAVGDVGFQKKCLGKMDQVAHGGRTVLFVSHNMAAIKSLCSKCYWLERGSLAAVGSPEQVVSQYVQQFERSAAESELSVVDADRGEGTLVNPAPRCGQITVACGDPISVDFEVESAQLLDRAAVGITILNAESMRVVSMSSLVQNVPSRPGPSRVWKVHCDLGRLPLNAGTYYTVVYLADERREVARFSNAQMLTVGEHDVFGWGNRLPVAEHWGPFYWAPDWDIRPGGNS